MANWMRGQSGPVVVHINAVDTVNRRASGMWADGSECDNNIDTSYHVGALQLTPAVGDTWMVESVGNGTWRLVDLMPIGTQSLSGTTTPAPGQTQMGSSGPTELHGSSINAHAPVRLQVATTRPDAVAAGMGATIYDATLKKPLHSDGVVWRDSSGVAV